MTQSDEEDAWMFAEPGICVLGGLGPSHLRNPPSSLTKKRSTVGRALPKVTSPSLARRQEQQKARFEQAQRDERLIAAPAAETTTKPSGKKRSTSPLLVGPRLVRKLQRAQAENDKTPEPRPLPSRHGSSSRNKSRVGVNYSEKHERIEQPMRSDKEIRKLRALASSAHDASNAIDRRVQR